MYSFKLCKGHYALIRNCAKVTMYSFKIVQKSLCTHSNVSHIIAIKFLCGNLLHMGCCRCCCAMFCFLLAEHEDKTTFGCPDCKFECNNK